MRNLKLKIAYDGTKYLGWQRTQMGPSIEETLETALIRILQHPVYLQAASRTDAGVHAHEQIVNFTSPNSIVTDKLKVGLNSILPKDIAIFDVGEMHEDFHPTVDCKSKEYHYFVCHDHWQLPHHRNYAWHFPCELDFDVMEAAIELLNGQHDFSAFCNLKKTHKYSHYVRRLEKIELHVMPNNCLRIEIKGNNFLYKMVRNLVGTLIYIGCGKLNLNDIPYLFIEGDRRKAGMTAPAKGLFLHQVNY